METQKNCVTSMQLSNYLDTIEPFGLVCIECEEKTSSEDADYDVQKKRFVCPECGEKMIDAKKYYK